ncbi:MAG TPA: methyltransferase domain-containing protein [Solirubrobacterales bacterium]|jgi:trans-aconitate 2-methyltransferase|nr:methyltransferase domain-containing protein [Solirubrobacterales bacterium]
MAGVREWDAATYRRISVPHEEWARAVLERLPLQGDEVVLDAGCGTGRVTRMLVERLPEGRVIAVDGSEAMIAEVRDVLRPADEAFAADLTALELPEPVDAVVSSAVFHWIHDHDLLFRRMRACLRPGGRLAAQCGGAGNIDAFRRAGLAVSEREPYAPHFEDFGDLWHYAGAEETEARLRAAGFEGVRCWLEPWQVIPPEPDQFTRTIMLSGHIDRLPAELHDRFVADVLAEAGEPLVLDYVRLNIEAVAVDSA